MMNTQRLVSVVVAAALAAAFSAGAVHAAGTKDSSNSPVRAESPMPLNRTAALFGSPAPIGTTTRTITLTPGMKYMQVASGESVAFQAGEKSVGWTFKEAIGGTSVDMKNIFPDIAEAKGIRAYIAPSQIFFGG